MKMIRNYRKIDSVMENPNTQALYRYWNELRAGRDAPGRSEVDPRRISGSLETMFIIEARDDGQMRFRLAGTKLCEWLGMEARGCVAEAVMAPGHEMELADLARRVLRAPGVGVMRLRALDGAGTDWSGEALLLPLRSELGDLARVMGCVNLDAGDRRRQPQPPLRLRSLGSRLTPIEIDPSQATHASPARMSADPLGAVRAPKAGGRGPGTDSDGFAEPDAGFSHAPRPGEVEHRPQLTAIEGNPSAPRPTDPSAPRRGRPNLRLVKD